MDIHEFMKSATEDQMEMMLMQMEKLPDFSSGGYDDDADIPAVEFNEDSDDNNINPTLNNYDVNSYPFMDPHHHSHNSFSSGDHPYHPSPNGWQDEFSGKSEKQRSSMAAMREMIFRIAAMQPVHIDPESVKPPKRKNVKISTDPQSVAARHRRERISERIRILQRLVPGGTKMDTASMLDEAIHYVKFLKNQVQSLERVAANRPEAPRVGFPVPMSSGSYFPAAALAKGYHQQYPPAVAYNMHHLSDD